MEGDESAKAFSQETILRRQMKNGTGTDCRNFAAGIADEMNSALQYIALAGKHGDTAIKKEFLSYAGEELRHAQKLLSLMEQLQAEVQDISLSVEEMDDL